MALVFGKQHLQMPKLNLEILMGSLYQLCNSSMEAGQGQL